MIFYSKSKSPKIITYSKILTYSFASKIISPLRNQQNGASIPNYPLNISFIAANVKWRLTRTVEEDKAERPRQTMSRSRQATAAGEQTARISWGHLASPTAAEKGCGRPLLLTGKDTHLPGQVLLGPWGCRQVDAQHDGVRWGGEDAGDDGVSHVEGKHGVYHEDDKEEEGHLEREGKQACQKIPVPLLFKQAENNILTWGTTSQTHRVQRWTQSSLLGKTLATEVWGLKIESREPCKSGCSGHTVLHRDRKWTLEDTSKPTG